MKQLSDWTGNATPNIQTIGSCSGENSAQASRKEGVGRWTQDEAGDARPCLIVKSW